MSKKRKDFDGFNMNKKEIFKIDYEGHKIIVRDYLIMDTIFKKAHGLMFRSNNFKDALLFPFDNDGFHQIHSLFCKKFLGVWMKKTKNKIKIIDVKIVNSWKLSVVPKEKFNLLLEIPLSSSVFRNI